MTESNINIKVDLDADKVPQQIKWTAEGSSAETDQIAKAMLLAFWDGSDKSALKIDLWTKEMMTDEMADFYFQVFMTMADTFERATRQEELANDIKKFASDFHKKFLEKENAQQ
ncbi:MAG: gliding motility protein GldC [Ginsengibacter sp.]